MFNVNVKTQILKDQNQIPEHNISSLVKLYFLKKYYKPGPHNVGRLPTILIVLK